MTTLLLGPVRAGKSARANALARASGKPVLFVATAAFADDDAEMHARIERHRRDRPAEWTVIETARPASPTLPAILAEADPATCIVVDALGTWLAATLYEWRAWAERDATGTLDALAVESDGLVDALATTRAEVILVAEETGWGIVPATPLARIFRDALGRLTRRLAARVDRVELVVAGYAVDLRAIGRPIDEV
jgi:adenosylcobinamide kinase/adenosylcobinamide-phosphate guanylyltransferase